MPPSAPGDEPIILSLFSIRAQLSLRRPDAGAARPAVEPVRQLWRMHHVQEDLHRAAIGTFALGAVAGTASAAPTAAAEHGKPEGIACQQAGISTLQSLGLLSAVARSGIEVVGVGTVPFRDVLALHRSDPELFQTGDVGRRPWRGHRRRHVVRLTTR